MRTCPRCGYVDPAAVAAAKAHEKVRPKRDRAAYMRRYRKGKRPKG